MKCSILLKIALFSLMYVAAEEAVSGTLNASSPAPDQVSINWSDVSVTGFQSYINEQNSATGESAKFNISSTSGSVNLNRLSGQYPYTLSDCTDMSYPPGQLILCDTPPQARIINVLPVCSEYFPNLPSAFRPSDYSIYQGDFDGDNENSDFLFVGKDRFILLHGDIVTPIQIARYTGFKLIRQPDGSFARYSLSKNCEGVEVTDEVLDT